ncbi:hypothetical protein [Dawidia soli]|uniref:PKD domain-containing protein n=1 Tax=Dawidia soli TaxID=2782352 RepID=A0AAP2D7R1_9BACT|nr:hypothetical protein [Dawidia soli]MBT1686986.1 hypothetical protein [Dawidia soli]
MKRIIKFSILLLLAFVWQHCTEDQAPAKPGNVRFTISPTGGPGGRVSASLPEGASLYVTIQEAGGGEVYTLEHVTLLKMGEEYISEPLALPPGNYDLTDFLVVNAADEVVYATPKEGSDMAGWVDDPLPMAFGVNDNAITGLSVQVVSTSAYPPAAFGYLTFQVGIVPGTSFRLAVFKPTPTGFVFSPAQVYILDGADTVHRQHVGAAPGAILFDGDLTRTYTLVVLQPSYKKYTQTFVLQDLLSALAGAPHTVWLEPAFTFRLTDQDVYFTLEGDIDTLYIDWGDGTQDIITQQTFESRPEHLYATPGGHFVSISGATLNKVERVAFAYAYGGTTEMSVEYLTGLKDFVATFAVTPATIDFSHNPALESIYIAVSDIVELDLSHNPQIRSVVMFGILDFSVPSLNALIHHLYSTAVQYNRRNGSFEAHSFPVSMTTFIGPPSPEAMEELRILRDTYDWTIDPADF